MRLDTIRLSWFRGAADSAKLEAKGKSMVVYGMNAAGKSSFVDAVEFAVNGKIEHLAHEYSGKKQEKAILNTHKPKGATTEFGLKFTDGKERIVTISDKGIGSHSGADHIDLDSWDYRRTVLRQDEVAHFIRGTKGDKYSALLPLLGLAPLEYAAENVRQIKSAVTKASDLTVREAKVKAADNERQKFFKDKTDEVILAEVVELRQEYIEGGDHEKSGKALCEELEVMLDTLLANATEDQKRHTILLEIGAVDIRFLVEQVEASALRLASEVGPTAKEKMSILRQTAEFVKKTDLVGVVDCPACGRGINVGEFQDHIRLELESLSQGLTALSAYESDVRALIDGIKTVRSGWKKPEVQSARRKLEKIPELLVAFGNIDLNPEDLRTNCGPEELEFFEHTFAPLALAAKELAKEAPKSTVKLHSDSKAIKAALMIFKAEATVDQIKKINALCAFLEDFESKIRQQIRSKSQEVVNAISKDVQTMWDVLHPNEPITGIKLYMPEGADKAIDISLSFYGKEQDSPRLTLSEGYRNSLGLCIFLSMAKHDPDQDRPLLLDDVVVSLDREHRGMIRKILDSQFSERQIILLTHDRDWYSELRHQLDQSHWLFGVLMPYESPTLGIRWSSGYMGFDDAKSQLNIRPDGAANDARKIMDTNLSIIAEKLQVDMPYLRGDRNDKRTALDFVERIVSDGQKCFQKKNGSGYVKNEEGLAALSAAKSLLVTWANKGSHTFDVSKAEAEELITVCEAALNAFHCPACKKKVWYAEAESPELVKCGCDGLQWRYGKA